MRTITIALIIVITLPTFLFIQNIPARAEEAPRVIINEIFWSGSSLSIADEFIELYNTTNEPIDISGWEIAGAATNKNSLILPVNSTISALGFFVVANYSPANEKSILNIEADYLSASISLANSDAYYALRGPDGATVDAADDGMGAPFSGDNENKASMARRPGCWNGGAGECWFTATSSANIKPENTDLATPGADNAYVEPPIEPPADPPADPPSVDPVDPANPVDTPATTPLVLPPKILINEILPNPAEGSEWIELFNPTTSTADLAGWSLEDGAGRIASLSGEIEPGYWLYVLNSAKLNNGGDKIYIEYNEQIIDRVAYGNWQDEDVGDNAPCPGRGQSLARSPAAADTDNDFQDFKITTAPTPGRENQISAPEPESEPEPQPTTTTIVTPETPIITPETSTATIEVPISQPLNFASGTMIITEFMSNPPSGGVEWIEIYNPSTQKIILDSWHITDERGTPTNLSGEINSFEYLPIFAPRGRLNNDGDIISIFDPSGGLIDRVDYLTDLSSPPKGASLARMDPGVWQVSEAPTPGGENISAPLAEESAESEKKAEPGKSKLNATVQPQESGFDEAYEWQVGDKIILKAFVATAPGHFSGQYFFAGDEEGHGVQIYSYRKDFPELKVGDYIEINGELSQFKNIWRIKIKTKDDIAIIDSGQIKAIELSISEIGSENIGGLVKISGEITEAKKSYFYLDDGAEIKVGLAKNRTKNSSTLEIGARASATGILLATEDGFFLETRELNDILVFNEDKPAPAATENSPAATSERKRSNYAGLIPLGILVAAGAANIKKLKKLIKNKKEGI
ncbi:MAG: lamin tail domain-containing protein [Patescibacteria group bacterium]|nr:lamin tail domain-containing protein [Patescibacteria group bacterium]